MNIAKMNAMLTGSAAGFSAMCKEGRSSLGGFTGAFGSAAGKVAALGGAFGLALGANEIKNFIGGSIESIDAMKDQAESIGVTTDALSRMRYAASFAGVENDALAASVGKMLVNLDAASEDGGTAVKALRELGLSAAALKQMAPDEAFAAIADKIAGIENPADKATAATKIFGKAGRDLIPVLNQGSAGLKDFYTEADRLGVTVSQADATKVEQAADAMQRVQALVQGVGNTLAIELSPYITAAADEFVGMATSGGSIGPPVVAAVEMIATGVSYAMGTVDLFLAGWYTLQSGIQWVIVGVLTDLDRMGHAVVSVVNLIPGVEVEFAGLGGTIAMYADAAKANWSAAGDAVASVASGDRQQAVASFFDGVRARANEAAAATTNIPKGVAGAMATEAGKFAEQIEKLKQQAATVGLNGSAKLGADLKADGASDAQVKEAVGYQSQIDAFAETKKAQDEAEASAKQYYEATRTAAEKYAAEVERINALQAAGNLDADTAQRARDAAQQTLDDSEASKPEEKNAGPQLLQAGSQAAASFVTSIERREQRGDDQKQLVKESQQGNKLLEAIAKNTGTGGGTPVQLVVTDIA